MELGSRECAVKTGRYLEDRGGASSTVSTAVLACEEGDVFVDNVVFGEEGAKNVGVTEREKG